MNIVKNKLSLILPAILLFITQNSIGQVFVTDTTINNKINLDDYLSVETHLGDIIQKVDHNASLPDIYLKNASGTQYLRLIFFPGSTRNAFQRFEVGINTSRIKGTSLKKFISFKTESGISIGSSLDSVIAKKGKNYTKEKINGTIEITYRLTGLDSHPFLGSHNSPLYSAVYCFKKGKLYKFSFGFEYP